MYALHVPVAALMSFMNGGSADTGPLGSADSQDLGSAFGRASDVVPDSSTNGHTPSEGSQDPSSFQASLQGSQAGYGTRERGDARGPERQGSYNRWLLWRQQTQWQALLCVSDLESRRSITNKRGSAIKAPMLLGRLVIALQLRPLSAVCGPGQSQSLTRRVLMHPS